MTSATPPPPPPAPPGPPSLDPPAWQSPPPFGPQQRPALRRSRSDKVIGGVAGGLAEYSGIDALLWRVGFVALALAGGSGVLVYLLLWLLMPAGYASSQAGAEDRRPAGPRSPVPGITVAGLLIVVGLLALLTRITDWNPGPRGFLGAALLVVGLGLVAAAFLGGRTAKGGLTALGIVLALALIASTSAPWDRGPDGFGHHRGSGDRIYLPTNAEDVRSEYHGGIGDMTIDLSRVDVSNLDRPIRTRVDAGVGDVTIDVPMDADVRVDVESGMGSVSLFGEDGRADGSFAGTGTGSWVGDGSPEIVLSINAGIGDVEVDRA